MKHAALCNIFSYDKEFSKYRGATTPIYRLTVNGPPEQTNLNQ